MSKKNRNKIKNFNLAPFMNLQEEMMNIINLIVLLLFSLVFNPKIVLLSFLVVNLLLVALNFYLIKREFGKING